MNEISPATRQLIERVEAALPEQKTDEFTRYSEGLLYASVCTSLSDEEATERMNALPSGTSGGWQLSEDKTFSGGESHPCPCDAKPQTHRHLLFEA